MQSLLFPYLQVKTQSGRQHSSLSGDTRRRRDTDRFIAMVLLCESMCVICICMCSCWWALVCSCLCAFVLYMFMCMCVRQDSQTESYSSRCVTVSVPLIVQLYCSGTREDSSVSLGDN